MLLSPLRMHWNTMVISGLDAAPKIVSFADCVHCVSVFNAFHVNRENRAHLVRCIVRWGRTPALVRKLFRDDTLSGDRKKQAFRSQIIMNKITLHGVVGREGMGCTCVAWRFSGHRHHDWRANRVCAARLHSEQGDNLNFRTIVMCSAYTHRTQSHIKTKWRRRIENLFTKI